MRLLRRMLPLLLIALLAGVPAVAHAQGGAGDDQYSDPFGPSSSGSSTTGSGSSGSSKGSGSSSSGSSSSSSGSSSSGSSSSGSSAAPATRSTAPTLTQDPGLASDPAATSTAASTSATATAAELPRTGMNAPLVALLGVGLLAAGIGLRLRLRTVDGRAG
jgi:LPXTG-motif cell wall-anchored protein